MTSLHSKWLDFWSLRCSLFVHYVVVRWILAQPVHNFFTLLLMKTMISFLRCYRLLQLSLTLIQCIPWIEPSFVIHIDSHVWFWYSSLNHCIFISPWFVLLKALIPIQCIGAGFIFLPIYWNSQCPQSSVLLYSFLFKSKAVVRKYFSRSRDHPFVWHYLAQKHDCQQNTALLKTVCDFGGFEKRIA